MPLDPNPAVLPRSADEWVELIRMIPGYDSTATARPTDEFSIDRAEFAIRFFHEYLKFFEGRRAGNPFILERWQQAIVANLFGWLDCADRELFPNGRRRYRECLLYVARKNGKTPFATGIMLLVAYTDQEAAAMLFSAAADREQAALVLRHAEGMIRQDPELEERAEIFKSAKSIEFDGGAGPVFRSLSSEAGTKHGLNVHFAIIDEVHAHDNRELLDVLVTGTASRHQWLVIYTTTADFDRPSICNEVHGRASKIRDGIIDDPSFLPVIYETPKDMDWTTEEAWRRANPNLGVSVQLDWLERECAKAKDTPGYEATFRRLHCNQITQSVSVWLNMQRWDDCTGPIAWRDLPQAMKGRSCYLGLDMASTDDIAAAVLVFRETIDDRPWYTLVPRFWIPEAQAKKRAQQARLPYLEWIQQGAMQQTEGDTIDQGAVMRDLRAWRTEYDIREAPTDPFDATWLMNQLQEDGVTVVSVPQRFANMTSGAKELEACIRDGRILHGGHPVLRWMASNAMIQASGDGQIRPSKKRSTEKIDGITASVLGIGRAMLATEGKESVYEQRGVLIL